MKEEFDSISYKMSKAVTVHYSTSFSVGIKLLDPSLRIHIYNIYGYVRLVDEIVDSFHDYNKAALLTQITEDTRSALQEGISTNPIINSFQFTVNKFQIPFSLVRSFLDSMEMDLHKTAHDKESYDRYIFGSAEVVGLMCLHVFCNGDKEQFSLLEPYAKKLGSAFQKVNFLRDIQVDADFLGRQYFPHFDFGKVTPLAKLQIEEEIDYEFSEALRGIKLLPPTCRRGVYIAYVYYKHLLKKVKQSKAEDLCKKRIRVNNLMKVGLLLRHNLFRRI